MSGRRAKIIRKSLRGTRTKNWRAVYRFAKRAWVRRNQPS